MEIDPTDHREVLKQGVFYPLGDEIWRRSHTMARWTGEKRFPKKGEWFLSGGHIEAFKAPNGISYAHYIAELVEVETVTIIREKKGKKDASV